jgi:outer membrane receptor for ferrienterochelin and colicins
LLRLLPSLTRSLLAVAFLLVIPMACPDAARADDVAEASALFASGNEHFQRSTHLTGARRTRELQAALDAYFASLRFVRSRNVLYNTALVLEQLGRWDDCFNYWGEYLAVTGLTDTERADGTTHRDAIRPHVAVLSITTTPAGAEVWVDRRDLASRGNTPIDLALPAGDHHLYFVLAGHRDTEATATTTMGQTTAVTATLPPMPVSLQVLAPDDGVLTLDGSPIRAGVATDVEPGPHVIHLEVAGMVPVERRLEIAAGAAPMVIDLAGSVRAAASTTTRLRVHSDADARVFVDGVEAGTGEDVVVAVEAGPREVRIEAPARAPYTFSRTFIAGDPLAMDVHLATGSDTGMLVMRGIFGLLAVAGLGTGIGLTVEAANLRARYDMEMDIPRATELADATDAANLRADVAWGVAAALGATALIFVFVDAGGGSSTGRFVLAPTDGGALMAASGRFGGL